MSNHASDVLIGGRVRCRQYNRFPNTEALDTGIPSVLESLEKIGSQNGWLFESSNYRKINHILFVNQMTIN